MADDAGAPPADQYEEAAAAQEEAQEAGAGKKRERDCSQEGAEPEAKRVNAAVGAVGVRASRWRRAGRPVDLGPAGRAPPPRPRAPAPPPRLAMQDDPSSDCPGNTGHCGSDDDPPGNPGPGGAGADGADCGTDDDPPPAGGADGLAAAAAAAGATPANGPAADADGDDPPPAAGSNPGRDGGAHGLAGGGAEDDAEIVHHPDGSVSEVMHISRTLVGKLIGKGGATIMGLQSATGVSIQVDQHTATRGGECRRVTLKGSPELVAAARAQVQAALDAEPGGAPAAAGEMSVDVACPPGVVGRIIGRAGETIKLLQAASGAYILVNQVRRAGGGGGGGGQRQLQHALCSWRQVCLDGLAPP
jgi:predicted RNA-binding protein YlqC (UPF0109 family)